MISLKRPAALTIILILLVAVVGYGQTSAPSSAATEVSLFVAVNGSDNDPGTVDKPFATLERARDQIRALKKAGKLKTAVTVNVRSGTYFLDRTFALSAEDSGTAEAPITYCGYAKERPLLFGGKRIKDFAQYKGQILVADLTR